MTGMTKDPVCGMTVEPSQAAASAEFADKTYFFCCVQCRQLFEKNPQKYAAAQDSSGCGGRCGGCCGKGHRTGAKAA